MDSSYLRLFLVIITVILLGIFIRLFVLPAVKKRALIENQRVEQERQQLARQRQLHQQG